MLKYNFKQGVEVTEEDGTPIKLYHVQMFMYEDGIDPRAVGDMLEMFANGFTGLVSEEFSDGEDNGLAEPGSQDREGWL
jgi:hypothetical protein